MPRIKSHVQLYKCGLHTAWPTVCIKFSNLGKHTYVHNASLMQQYSTIESVQTWFFFFSIFDASEFVRACVHACRKREPDIDLVCAPDGHHAQTNTVHCPEVIGARRRRCGTLCLLNETWRDLPWHKQEPSQLSHCLNNSMQSLKQFEREKTKLLRAKENRGHSVCQAVHSRHHDSSGLSCVQHSRGHWDPELSGFLSGKTQVFYY